MLPLKQAIKFPFIFYGNIKFGSLKGRVIIHSDKLKPAMFKFGEQVEFITPSNKQNYLFIKGIVEFTDSFVIANNYSIFVAENGRLTFGKDIGMGSFIKIMCFNSIHIDDKTRFGWGCQIYDSNFHYLRQTNSNQIDNRHGEIYIGKNNWIANSCNITKGTFLPDNTIVTSKSLVNKDLSEIPENSIVGGLPAKYIKNGYQRIFEVEIENQLIEELNEYW